MSEKNFVDLKTLRTDGGTQSRAALNWDVVDEYAALMQDGDEFPPVVAFDDGKTVWLADGFHRVAAAAQCKMESFPAVIHEGTQRDAILYSVSANNYHGLRFSNADKRENVKKLLLDEEWSEWSDRLIARKCGVSNTFVGSMRKELQLSTVDSKVVKKGDTKYKMDTANIGQNQPSSDDDPNLDPPQQHWLSRYRDETYLSEKPVLWPVNESRTVWVAFDNAAIQIAELIDAEWENVEVDNPATHSGKQTIPALKLFAVNNPAWFHALMSHVASEEYEFVYDPELKQVADRMRTAEYGEHTANMELTPLAAQAQGQPETPEEETAGTSDNIAPLMTSKSVEWYTPSEVVEAARRVLGSIDLDPCSCPEADIVVNAGVYYTIENDGLFPSMDWTAETLFMNPPYGDEVADWVNRLVLEFEDGNVKKAIAILPARTDTAWFRSLAEFPKCFVAGRLKFWGPNDNGNGATFPTVIVALGCDLADFAVEFEGLGDIYIPLNQAHLLVKQDVNQESIHRPESLSEALEGLVKDLDLIDIKLSAMEALWKSPQDQAYLANLQRSAQFGIGTFRDRVQKIAERPATLTAIATLLLDAATKRDIQSAVSQIVQSRVGDEASDAPLETLLGEAEARLEMIKAAEEAA